MQFTIAYINSSAQFLLGEFSDDCSINIKKIDTSELSNTNINALIYNEERIDSELLETLQSEIKFFPIRSSSDINIDIDTFEKMDFKSAKNLFINIQGTWVLQNNISVVDELIPILTHLSQLYPNERTSFFEELWFILSSTLGATNLKLIYNDLKKAEKPNEKNKLIKSKIEGQKMPLPLPGEEVDTILMNSYEKNFSSEFEILEYDNDRGELVIAMKVNQGPVLIMANTIQVTKLQKALLKSIFDGINKFLE